MPLYTGTFSFMDGAGVTSAMQLHIIEDTPEDAQAEFISIAGALDAITGGKLDSLTMTIPVDLATLAPGLQVVADPSSDVEVGARFFFKAGGRFPMHFTVPTFNENELATAQGPLIMTDPRNIAIRDTLIGPQGWSDYRGADIGAFIKAYKTFGGKPKRNA